MRVGPEMQEGVAGKLVITPTLKEAAVPDPQSLFAETLMVPLQKLEFTLTVIELVVDEPVSPVGSVQL